MSHRVVIIAGGNGPGGTAESRAEWTPSHDLSGNEQLRRIEKATRLLEKVNDVLYGGGSGPDQGP